MNRSDRRQHHEMQAPTIGAWRTSTAKCNSEATGATAGTRIFVIPRTFDT